MIELEYNPLTLWSKETVEKRIENIGEFFTIVQGKTGLFEDKSRIPYKLYDKQIEWVTQLFDTRLPQKRALLGSRDKGKSEVVTILGTAWMLYLNPKVKIGVMSRKYANAKKLTNQVLKIMISLGQPLMSTAGGYYTYASNAHTPNLSPLGLQTAVRGMHFDYMILDDPITSNEEYSRKFIDRSRQYLSEAQSIAKYTILIGQLLTRNDVYHDAWTDKTGYYHVMQSWHGDIPQLDRDLVKLEHEMLVKDIARNYIGEINDESEEIFSSIKFDDSYPSGYTYAFIDPSAKGQNYTAVALGWEHENRLVFYGQIFKYHWGDCIEDIAILCKDCRTVYFEDNLGLAIKTSLGSYGIISEGITTTTNKIKKIYALKGMIRQDQIRLCIRTPKKAVEQVVKWNETAEHDDLPDAIVMLVKKITWLLRYK